MEGNPIYRRRKFLGRIAALTDNVALKAVPFSGVPTAPMTPGAGGIVELPPLRCFIGPREVLMRPPLVEVWSLWGGTAITSIDVRMQASRAEGALDALESDPDSWGDPDNTRTFAPATAPPVSGRAGVWRYATLEGSLLGFWTSNQQGAGSGDTSLVLIAYAIMDLKETIS